MQVSSSKREREYARRRHEKWLARQAEIRARRRRQRVIAGVVVGVLALVTVVLLVLDLTRSEPAPTADPQASATAEPDQTTEPDQVVPTETPRAIPDAALAEARTWTANLRTTVGDLTLELDGAAAPQAVASFVTLAQEGFFDGTTCHRLVTVDYHLLQCGDPTGTGFGGPGYRFGPIENAPADGVYPAGTVAMARADDDGASMGSQFFLVYEDTIIPADTAGGYTVLGTIMSGMDVLTGVADAGTAEGAGQTPVTEVTIEGVETQ